MLLHFFFNSTEKNQMETTHKSLWDKKHQSISKE